MCRRLRVIGTEASAIGVGCFQRLDMRLQRPGVWPAVGGKCRYRIGHTMIRVGHHQSAAFAGDNFGDAPGGVVRLAAAVDEQAGLQPGGHGGGQALGIVDDRLMEVAGVGAERCHLPANGGSYTRIAVADRRHVVIGVEIAPAIRFIQIHAFAPHQMQRLAVGEFQAAP